MNCVVRKPPLRPEIVDVSLFVLVFLPQVHQFERELDRLRARQKTEMEQKLKQMMADERRLLKHIKDKHDSDMKAFVSEQKAAYKAAKNQFKKVCAVNVTVCQNIFGLPGFIFGCGSRGQIVNGLARKFDQSSCVCFWLTMPLSWFSLCESFIVNLG